MVKDTPTSESFLLDLARGSSLSTKEIVASRGSAICAKNGAARKKGQGGDEV